VVESIESAYYDCGLQHGSSQMLIFVDLLDLLFQAPSTGNSSIQARLGWSADPFSSGTESARVQVLR